MRYHSVMTICQVAGCVSQVKARGMCNRHYCRWRRHGDPLKGSAYVMQTGPDRWRNFFEVDGNGCWIWTRSLDRKGYGQYGVRAGDDRKNYRAHRYVYQQLVRPLDAEEHLDHLCRVHACVNPAHLEPVTHAENVRRGDAGLHNAVKTHCPQGHPYDEKNTLIYAKAWRRCIICHRKATRNAQRRRRARLRGATVSD